MRFFVVAVVIGFASPAVADPADKDVHQVRDEAIATLTKDIRALPSGEPKAVKMVQLAELYWERGDAAETRDTGAADASYRKAVQIYEYVLKKHPKRKSDQAHFYLGAYYLRTGDKAKATVIFDKLCEKYPSSQFCKDATDKLEELANDPE